MERRLQGAYRPHQWQGRQPHRTPTVQNLKTSNGIDRILDATVAQGGPIKKDKWFFASARYFR